MYRLSSTETRSDLLGVNAWHIVTQHKLTAVAFPVVVWLACRCWPGNTGFKTKPLKSWNIEIHFTLFANRFRCNEWKVPSSFWNRILLETLNVTVELSKVELSKLPRTSSVLNAVRCVLLNFGVRQINMPYINKSWIPMSQDYLGLRLNRTMFIVKQ